MQVIRFNEAENENGHTLAIEFRIYAIRGVGQPGQTELAAMLTNGEAFVYDVTEEDVADALADTFEEIAEKIQMDEGEVRKSFAGALEALKRRNEGNEQ